METPASATVLGAFVTGSQAYGTATKDSDIDLVCFVSEETKQQLIELAGGLPIRFGKLNLILETSVGMFAAWKAAKEACVQSNKDLVSQGLKPLTKLEVCHIHGDYGIPQREGNPSHTPESREAAAEYRQQEREQRGMQ